MSRSFGNNIISLTHVSAGGMILLSLIHTGLHGNLLQSMIKALLELGAWGQSICEGSSMKRKKKNSCLTHSFLINSHRLLFHLFLNSNCVSNYYIMRNMNGSGGGERDKLLWHCKNKTSQFLKVYSFNLEELENHIVMQDFS